MRRRQHGLKQSTHSTIKGLAVVETPTPEDAIRDAIRHWSCLSELADFAVDQNGFGNSDGGFGITYPGDLDEYDRAQGEQIPVGFVKVYGFWGLPDGYEVLVAESLYLQTLASLLSAGGHVAEAEQVRLLLAQQKNANK